MEMTEQTTTRLKFERVRPYFQLSDFLPLLLIVFLFGFAAIFMGAGSTTLTCQRNSWDEINCEIVRDTIFTGGTTSVPLLWGAEVDRRIDSDNHIQFWTVLISEVGDVDFRSSGRRGTAEKRVVEINTFIGDPNEERLEIIDRHLWFPITSGMILLLCGFAVIYKFFWGKHPVAYIFDRRRSTLTVERESRFGTTQLTEYGLDKIVMASVKERRDSDAGTTYFTSLDMDGERPFDLEIDSREAENQAAADAINRFLLTQSTFV